MSRRLTDEDLHRYVDGELSRRQARRVHALLDADEAGRRKAASLDQMHGMLRQWADDVADEADFSALWGQVQRGIATEEVRSPDRGPSADDPRPWLFRRGFLVVSAAAAAMLLLVWLSPLRSLLQGPTPSSNACVIESLEVGTGAVSTIFTIEDPEAIDSTTVIWISDNSSRGGTT